MRRFNWQIWVGFLLSLVTFLSWFTFFVKWPVTRDVPWANLLLLGTAVTLLVVGVRRAFAPGRFRLLRIAVSLIVAVLSAAVLANFVFIVFVTARSLPVSEGAPHVGQKAPDFTLADASGTPVSLSALLSTPVALGSSVSGGPPAPKFVLLIFYMYSGCRACNSEFRGVQQNLDKFRDAGILPVAISIDTPDVSRELSRQAGYTFTFLSDPKLDVIRRYDLVHENAGARPAEFLLDSAGIVRWRNLTNDVYVRARPEQILAAAKVLP